MADIAPNSPIAEAVIPVKADLSEFTRQFDDALEAISRKMGEAADAAAKGFKDKMLAALDEVSQRLDPLIEKAGAFNVQAAPQPAAKEENKESDDLVIEVRNANRSLEDLEKTANRIEGNMSLIVSKLGNIR